MLGISMLKKTAPADKSDICKGFLGSFGPLGLENALENTAPADKSSVAQLDHSAPVTNPL